MPKRFLSLFFVLMLVLGGAAACGDDGGDDGGSDGGGSEDSGDSGDSGDSTDSGNAEVQAYCDDVAALAEEIEAADGDPTALGDLSTQVTDLTTTSSELAGSGLSAEDGEAITECTQQLTDAAASLAP